MKVEARLCTYRYYSRVAHIFVKSSNTNPLKVGKSYVNIYIGD